MKAVRPISAPKRHRGFSLIELMVGVGIGLVITLAVFQVLTASEARKRTSTGLNDASQSGNYALYVLDRMLRSAGTGYSQGWATVGGCRLNALLPGGESLPRVGPLPAPFTAIPQTFRLAPVIIFQGASDTGSDVLMVMSGATGYGEVLTNVPAGGVAATQVALPNTIGYRAGDLVLLASSGECLLSQVDVAKPPCAGDPAAPLGTACGPILPLGGTYYTPAGANMSLATLALQSDVSAFSIGNATTNPPQFALIGVGADSTLFAHNLLLINGANASEPVAEGVRELHAVYGLDTNDDGILDAWQSPTALWAGPALMDGSAASNARLRQIVAVRVGMVLRSSLVERELSPGVPVAPANLPLFSDLPAPNPITVDLTRAGENRNQRHRTVEITVPLRNFLMRTTS